MITLINDDSLKYLATLADNSVDCVLTDPPYGILKHKIETHVDIADFILLATQKLKVGGFFCFFGKQPTLTHWNRISIESGLTFKEEVIWYKRQRSTPMGDMGKVHENISIFSKGKGRLRQARIAYTDLKESLDNLIGGEGLKRTIGHLTLPYKNRFSYERALRFLNAVESGGDLKEFYDTKSGQRNEYVTMSKSEKRVKSSGHSAVECSVLGSKAQSVVSFMPHNKQKFDSTGQGGGEYNLKHPTIKPLGLMEWLIELLTSPGDLILDPFLGTGSTAVAAQKKGRRCIGIELNKEYFEIAQSRLIGEREPNQPSLL